MFIFTPKLGEMILFDEHIFQMGWNHQLVVAELKRSMVLLNVGLPSGLFARDLARKRMSPKLRRRFLKQADSQNRA